MNSTFFIEQAKQNTLSFFHAYGIENDMVKVLNMFSKQSALIGWGSKEIYLDYEAICATAHQRMTIPFYVHFDDISMEIINATDSFCVVLVTAHLTYHADKSTIVRELERATFVYRREQDEAKIAYLHSSAAKKLHDLGKILPLVHGAEATRRLTKQECDRSMAIDMCEHTPNGLIYCLIGEHYPMVYANQTMCQLMGCKDFTEFMAHTRGRLESVVHHEDLQRVKAALLSHTNALPYTITYRIVTKQGQFKWVVGRGQSVVDADTGEEYYICTLIPLELEQRDFSYGNLVDYAYIENAPISVELFLQQTLDYIHFKDRDSICQKLLQHCCTTMQASGAILSSIKEPQQRIPILHSFDMQSNPSSCLLNNYSWEEIAGYFSEDGLSLYTDSNDVFSSAVNESNGNADTCSEELLRSAISRVVPVQGKGDYLLTVYHRGKPHIWTDNEQDLVLQTTKLLSLVLNEDF